jgi:hypothetical protein
MKLTTGGSAIVTDTIRYIQGSEPPKQVGENIIAGYTAKMSWRIEKNSSI